jgi:hypothetical protein
MGAQSTVPSAEELMSALRKFEDIRQNVLRKSTTAVTGLELVRQDLEQQLKLAANLDTPLRNRLKRRRGNGKAHAYYKLTSNPGATVTNAKFLGTDPPAGFFGKGGLPASVDPQYSYVSRPYANLGDTVTVPWQDIAQDESFIDIKAQQRRVKMLNVGLMEEWAIINGSTASSSGLIFDGLLSQITTDGFNILDVSGGGGSALKYSLIQQLIFTIRKAGGRTRALVMSYAVYQLLTQLLGALYAIRQVGNSDSGGKFNGGFQLDTWNFGNGSVDLIADQYMLPDSVTGLENIIFLDDQSLDSQNNGSVIEMVDVDPIHYQELMAIQTAERGIVYETSMMQIGVTQYQGMIKGINTSLTPSMT